MNTSIRLRPFLALICVIIILNLISCGSSEVASESRIWLDVPLNDTEVSAGQSVHLEGHATHRSGIAQIQIWVDGALTNTISPEAGTTSLVRFEDYWTAASPGEHILQVVAVGSDGTGSQPDTVSVRVIGESAEITPPPDISATASLTPTLTPSRAVSGTPTATYTDTPTLTPTYRSTRTPTPTIPPPVTVIQFWADSQTPAAGTCTTLHWHVENVQAVFLDGTPVVGDGTYNTCPCVDETHTLSVAHLDGREEQRTITLDIQGVCPTPVTADTTPPAAPVPLKPLNGQSFNCEPKVMLRWQAVVDSSGIASYRVEVERHAGNSVWKAVSGSPWQGLTVLQLELNIECGWTYRWRVLAVDGAGNIGAFSGWFTFADLLT